MLVIVPSLKAKEFFSKVLHYFVPPSELLLLDMFDQHGSPVCVCGPLW